MFTVSEFLTELEIQSYFSRRASKLRHSHSDDPESDQDEIMTAKEEIAHENVRAAVLDEVGLSTQLFSTLSTYVTRTRQVNCDS